MTTPNEMLEDAMSECDELLTEHAKPLVEALETVACVENMSDAIANMRDALAQAKALVADLEKAIDRAHATRSKKPEVVCTCPHFARETWPPKKHQLSCPTRKTEGDQS